MKYVNKNTLQTVFTSELELYRWIESIYGYAERSFTTTQYKRPADFMEKVFKKLELVAVEDEEDGFKGVF